MAAQGDLIAQFIEITGTDENTARFYLTSCEWDIQVKFATKVNWQRKGHNIKLNIFFYLGRKACTWQLLECTVRLATLANYRRAGGKPETGANNNNSNKRCRRRGVCCDRRWRVCTPSNQEKRFDKSRIQNLCYQAKVRKAFWLYRQNVFRA